MAFSNGKCSLTRRKNGDFTNSTKTCEVNLGLNGEFYQAYSYAEKIAIVDFKNKVVLYNDHKFSVTTNAHQWAVYKFIERQYPNYKHLSIDCYSINNLDLRDPMKFFNEVSGLRYTQGLADYISVLGNKKKDLKFLENLIKENEEADKRAREEKNREIRVKNLRKKIEALDYKTPKALEVALDKFKKEAFHTIHILEANGWQKVESFKAVLDNHREIVDYRLWEISRLSKLNGPASYLDERFKALEGVVILNANISDLETAKVVLKNLDKINTTHYLSKIVIKEAKRLAAIEVFSELGSDEDKEAV